MNSGQLKKSYVLGMYWFIFSEVMFFAAFFGALFYVRNLAGPWLAGEGEGGRMNLPALGGLPVQLADDADAAGSRGRRRSQLIANNGTFVSPRPEHGLRRGARLVCLAAAVEHDHPAVLFRDGAHRAHRSAEWRQEEVQHLAGGDGGPG
jgi:hypothetical protein